MQQTAIRWEKSIYIIDNFSSISLERFHFWNVMELQWNDIGI